MEHEAPIAVVSKPCTKVRHKTMHARICAVVLSTQIISGTAFAVENNQPANSPGLFQGTAEEQAACSPDATKFCHDAIPDTFRVLACLQDHRKQLRKRSGLHRRRTIIGRPPFGRKVTFRTGHATCPGTNLSVKLRMIAATKIEAS